MISTLPIYYKSLKKYSLAKRTNLLKKTLKYVSEDLEKTTARKIHHWQ